MENKNKKTLESFNLYCKQNPEERFWQALRNWSKYMFIYGSKDTTSDQNFKAIDLCLEDTFYNE